jgi:alkanesulfonate monooxygenase SsuD/methylene tetrahydromethanopterin reductase-like flavin-dependent oxidoreductase (luciferase family)
MAMWNIKADHPDSVEDALAQRVADFRRICAEEGRNPDDITICQTLYVAVAATQADADAIADEAHRVFVMPDRPFAGTPDLVVRFLAERHRQGVRDFELTLVSKYLKGRGTAFHRGILELVGREVAPALRAAVGVR